MTEAIIKGQALAKKRIVLYLTLFLGIAISSKHGNLHNLV